MLPVDWCKMKLQKDGDASDFGVDGGAGKTEARLHRKLGRYVLISLLEGQKSSRLATITLGMLLPVIVSGCSLVNSNKLMRADAYVTQGSAQIKDGKVKDPINLDSFKFNVGDTESAYSKASKAQNGVDRNRLQSFLLRLSDVNCARYVDDMYARVAARKVVLKSITLLSGSAAAVVSGELAKSVLGAVSAVATGTDAILDAEILQNQVITLVATQINAQRASIAAEIRRKREEADQQGNQSLVTYSLEGAIHDVDRYHQACGFLPAIVELTKESQRVRVTKASLDAERGKLMKEKDDIDTRIRNQTNQNILKIENRRLEQIGRRLEEIDILLRVAE
ncbi:MAG: hypothetical protein QNJ30_03195 [Kiloniellales bacterium]|nr:hypothetical protein [Kiloniellales bacterium]